MPGTHADRRVHFVKGPPNAPHDVWIASVFRSKEGQQESIDVSFELGFVVGPRRRFEGHDPKLSEAHRGNSGYMIAHQKVQPLPQGGTVSHPCHIPPRLFPPRAVVAVIAQRLGQDVGIRPIRRPQHPLLLLQFLGDLAASVRLGRPAPLPPFSLIVRRTQPEQPPSKRRHEAIDRIADVDDEQLGRRGVETDESIDDAGGGRGVHGAEAQAVRSLVGLESAPAGFADVEEDGGVAEVVAAAEGRGFLSFPFSFSLSLCSCGCISGVRFD
mmetsp:Transcript_30925/g.62240  ORF Transcript_30925/g.62240 Transcript_30925/m.62240 type:complete len:270 (+) Transcript_30925:643-1452(+)